MSLLFIYTDRPHYLGPARSAGFVISLSTLDWCVTAVLLHSEHKADSMKAHMLRLGKQYMTTECQLGPAMQAADDAGPRWCCLDHMRVVSGHIQGASGSHNLTSIQPL